jgi:hypothetical protein
MNRTMPVKGWGEGQLRGRVLLLRLQQPLGAWGFETEEDHFFDFV